MTDKLIREHSLQIPIREDMTGNQADNCSTKDVTWQHHTEQVLDKLTWQQNTRPVSIKEDDPSMKYIFTFHVRGTTNTKSCPWNLVVMETEWKSR